MVKGGIMAVGPADITIEINVTKIGEIARYEQTTGVIGLLREALYKEEKLVRIDRSMVQRGGKVIARLFVTTVRVSTENETYLKTQFREKLTSIFGSGSVLRIEIFRLL
jgi:hypothetical protein